MSLIIKKNPLHILLGFIEIACIFAVLVSLFVNFVRTPNGSIFAVLTGDDKVNFFKVTKAIFTMKGIEMSDRFELFMDLIKSCKLVFIGIGLAFLGAIFGSSTKVRESNVISNFVIAGIGVVLGVVAIILIQPKNFLSKTELDIIQSMGSKVSNYVKPQIGSYLVYCGLLSGLLGIVDSILVIFEVKNAKIERQKRIEARKELEEQKAKQQAAALAAQISAAQAQAQQPQQTKSLEEKLIELKDLKEKGLITEEEFENKHKALLESY